MCPNGGDPRRPHIFPQRSHNVPTTFPQRTWGCGSSTVNKGQNANFSWGGCGGGSGGGSPICAHVRSPSSTFYRLSRPPSRPFGGHCCTFWAHWVREGGENVDGGCPMCAQMGVIPDAPIFSHRERPRSDLEATSMRRRGDVEETSRRRRGHLLVHLAATAAHFGRIGCEKGGKC